VTKSACFWHRLCLAIRMCCCWTNRPITSISNPSMARRVPFPVSNTVIVVSHDRHFLNQVCTHTADIDFGRIQIYVGNYDFWYRASRLNLNRNKMITAKYLKKLKNLKLLSSASAPMHPSPRQATSRKKLLDKLALEDMPTSSRKYPHVVFKPDRALRRRYPDNSGTNQKD
jgi:ATPase subunit of ABC transporter with duplicated ATPase domains